MILICLLAAGALAAPMAPLPLGGGNDDGGWLRPQAEEASLSRPTGAAGFGGTAAKKADLGATREALALSMGSRIEALRAQGPQGYRNLLAIMFDDRASMQARWKATTAVGRLGAQLSEPELERAYRRKEWFMRSAALVAMRNVNKERALSWAHALLSDRALVVRAAAVDAIDEIRSPASVPLLWKRLYSSDNYNQGDSLWIRRRIAEALARLEGPGSEAKFMKLLRDKDSSLHASAIDALERISQRTLGQPGAPVAEKRALWLAESKYLRRRL
jgi:HEAT repeat protein